MTFHFVTIAFLVFEFYICLQSALEASLSSPEPDSLESEYFFPLLVLSAFCIRVLASIFEALVRTLEP